MEAMLCLCVPHAPACRPDCLLSHPSRRNPLRRRHLAFPNEGDRVAAAAARLSAVCPQQPAGEDASRGRVEGSHRRRGAAVGPALVLASALRATGLKRGGRAYFSPPNSSGDGTSNQQHGHDESPPNSAGAFRGLEGLTLAPLMSGIFKKGPVAAKEPPELLQVVVDRIHDEIRFLRTGSEKPSLLLLLLQHLADQVAIHEHSSLEASDRGLQTTSLLYEKWGTLTKSERKYHLGLLQIQIFIYQGDYEKAKEVCEQNVTPSPMDARPQFCMAIIEKMMAMQRMLNPEKTS